MARRSKEAENAFSELLSDPSVDSRVKELLRQEYEPGTELFAIFVEHSWMVTEAALEIAKGVDADCNFVREAAWLHDIGIKYTHAPGIHCQGSAHYLRHGLIGQEQCLKVGLEAHGLVCLRHVGTGLTAEEILEQKLPLPAEDMLNETTEERIICYADQFFSKSRGGPTPINEVRRRISKFGSAPLERFESMFQEFGHLYPPSGS